MSQESSLAVPEPDMHGTDLRLKELWQVMFQRRRMIAAVAGAVLVTTVIFSFTRTSLYKASAVLQISPGGKINLVDDTTIEEVRARYAEFFATQQAILKSRNLAHRVMVELDLWGHPLFEVGEDDQTSGSAQRRAKQIEKFSKMLAISPIGNTQLIELSFITPEPELSVRMTNTLANQYIKYSAESWSDVARVTSDFIRVQIEKFRTEINEKEKLLREHSQKEDLVTLAQRESIVFQQLEQLNKELTEVQAERAAALARYESLRHADPDSFPEVLNNRTIQDLKREQAELEKRYTDLSSKFRPGYPELQRTRSAQEDIEQRLERESSEVANKVIAAERIRNETALRREDILQKRLEQQRQQTRDLNAFSSDVRRIQLEVDNQRNIVEQLLRRQSATGLSAELGQTQPLLAVRLVDEAVIPTSRHSPRHKVNLLLGTALGGVFGIGLAFLLHSRDGSLRTAEDIRRHVDFPFLGSVPHDPAPAESLRGPAHLALSEQAKFIPFLLFDLETPPKSILITSSEESEGKTFVASHLAASLTQLGKRVLLIDANLRSPNLHNIFGLSNEIGLSSVLTDTETVGTGCIRSTNVTNLSVILAGPHSSSPAGLLGSRSMETFLRLSTEQFDCVVLDSAPLLPVIDSHVLARQCDAVVLVTRSGCTNRQSVQTAQELIADEIGKITGVVLNDVENSRSAHNYHNGHAPGVRT